VVISLAFLFIYLELAVYIMFELLNLIRQRISSQPARYVSLTVLTVQLTEMKGEFRQILVVCILSITAVVGCGYIFLQSILQTVS
jgi:Tfp pilus assembly protein PilO